MDQPTRPTRGGHSVNTAQRCLIQVDRFRHGQFPDILSQVLEVKLQLARTIDLGLELPESTTPLASANGVIAVSDVRYAIFYGVRTGATFQLAELVVVTGRDFFKEFRQFGGYVSNSKLQLRLPSAWFA